LRALSRPAALIAVGALTLPAGGAEGGKKPPVVSLVERPAFPLEKHLESRDIAAGKYTHAQLFDAGAELFHAPFNGLDGVGMMRTVGGKPLHRFSNGPAGGGQPIAVGGQSCGSCHHTPFDAGAGLVHTRVFFDPEQDGEPPFSPRDTISLFGDGVVQLLAQEMTAELLAARDAAAAEARARPGTAARRELRAKGVSFGSLAATASPAGEVSVDLSGVRGISPDLVVRPMGWKGTVVTVRNLVVAAANFGLGMMGEEFVWRLPPNAQPDPDGDGVTRELSVGDVTAMTIYSAAQEAPAEVARLAALGLVAPPAPADLARVERGRQLFTQVGCTSCHVPEMRLGRTVFEEPTLGGGGQYLDRFLAGKDPDYDPARPARFDLLQDSQAPRIEAHPAGGAVVRLYGDLKRHDMGRTLAEPAGPVVPLDVTLSPLLAGGKPAFIGASEFLTPELWGVADTGPWLHDDRAGTLAEAIALHGEDTPPAPGQPGRSEAQESRDAFLGLGADDRGAVVTFLKSLVSFSAEGR
jgi:mono/diheme cytochrome c family protein